VATNKRIQPRFKHVFIVLSLKFAEGNCYCPSGKSNIEGIYSRESCLLVIARDAKETMQGASRSHDKSCGEHDAGTSELLKPLNIGAPGMDDWMTGWCYQQADV
jgi:hypothetical protein